MEPRRALITHPQDLASAAGTAYAVLVPHGDVLKVFDDLQGQLRDRLAGHDVSWAGPHVTLKGFGRTGAPLSREELVLVVDVIEGWASRTPPLELAIEAADVFAGEKIPILRMFSTGDLRDAITDLREAAAFVAPAGYEDRYSVEDWIFHASLAYCHYVPDEFWAPVENWLPSIEVPEAADLVWEVEIVSYDGGPERFVTRFHLAG